MIAAISAAYGQATLPASPSSPDPDPAASHTTPVHWEDSRYLLNLNYDDEVVAQWNDIKYSIRLFRSSSLATFGLVLISRQLDELARAATVRAIRQDQQEAPQRELERQLRQTAEDRAKQEAARRANIVTFRP
jgi:hypothetical protein